MSAKGRATMRQTYWQHSIVTMACDKACEKSNNGSIFFFFILHEADNNF